MINTNLMVPARTGSATRCRASLAGIALMALIAVGPAAGSLAVAHGPHADAMAPKGYVIDDGPGRGYVIYVRGYPIDDGPKKIASTSIIRIWWR